MILRPLAALAAAAGLAFAPLAADARLLFVPACGGGMHMLVLPADPGRKDAHPCAKPCHAITERRDKQRGDRGGCC